MSRIGRHIFDKQEIDEALDALTAHAQQLSRSQAEKCQALTPEQQVERDAYAKFHNLPF